MVKKGEFFFSPIPLAFFKVKMEGLSVRIKCLFSASLVIDIVFGRTKYVLTPSNISFQFKRDRTFPSKEANTVNKPSTADNDTKSALDPGLENEFVPNLQNGLYISLHTSKKPLKMRPHLLASHAVVGVPR